MIQPVLMLLLCDLTTWGRPAPEDFGFGSFKRNSKFNQFSGKKQPRGIVSDQNEYYGKQAELQNLLQQVYQAENTVRKETMEIRRIQEAVASADREMEAASNKVRSLSADLQEAQRQAAQKALKSHTAHLQMTAHDQLMFTSRQKVDALSAQIVSAQADLGSWPIMVYDNESFPVELEAYQSDSNFPAAFQPDVVGSYGKPVFSKNTFPRKTFYPYVQNNYRYAGNDED